MGMFPVKGLVKVYGMSKAKIHLCFECGQKNRLPAGTEASALCGGCGKKLYPNLSPPAQSAAAKEQVTSPERPKGAGAKSGAGIYWFILPSIAALIWFASSMSGSGVKETELNSAPSTTPSRWTPPAAEIAEPAIALVPQFFVPGVLWDATGEESIAPFEILSQVGDNQFVKLVDANTGQDAIAILVRGGERFEVDIPLGSYKMKWCSGETWYGETDRFGPEESCSMSTDIFHFRINGNYAEGNSVTLYTVSNGNMDTRRLDPSEF